MLLKNGFNNSADFRGYVFEKTRLMEAFIARNMFDGSPVQSLRFGIRVPTEPLGLQAPAGKKIPHKIRCEQTQVVMNFAGMMVKIVMCEIIHGAHKGTSVRIKTFMHLALLIL
jgi:hypothetical protein